LKLISLIDNTAVDDKLFSENGMSFFVEFGGKNYIIDTGLTGKAAENARRMQLPTDELDAVVLTHNHAAHVSALTLRYTFARARRQSVSGKRAFSRSQSARGRRFSRNTQMI